MNDINISPELQFQIGEQVLYKPQGIYTAIHSYTWLTFINEPPKIMGYVLACGITARWKDLAKVDKAEQEAPQRPPPSEPFRKV